MNDKRKPGRPALPPEKKLAVVPVRLTAEQKAKHMTNLETVRAYVRGEYSYDDVTDPLTVVKIARINMPPLPEQWVGIQAGDYDITDAVTACVVRVEAGNVRVIWKNRW